MVSITELIGIVVSSGIIQLVITHFLGTWKRKLDKEETTVQIQNTVRSTYQGIIDDMQEELTRLRLRVKELSEIENQKWVLQHQVNTMSALIDSLRVELTASTTKANSLEVLNASLRKEKDDLEIKLSKYEKPTS